MIEYFKTLGMPQVAAAHGAQLDDMLAYVHWLMLALFVGWGAFYIIMLFRFRAKKNPKADYHGVKSHFSSYLEVAVALVEALLIVLFAMPLWAERVNDFPSAQDSTVVRVVAEQFAWNVHYPGEDGEFGRTDATLVDTESNPLGLDANDPKAMDDITTINQLHIPVDKPVIVHLTSKDVIHSFGVPEFRVKQDAIPGLSIPMWWTPTVTSKEMGKLRGKENFSYEIACAQLCGIGHYRMKGYVNVHTQEEYDKWMSEQTPLLASSGEEDEW